MFKILCCFRSLQCHTAESTTPFPSSLYNSHHKASVGMDSHTCAYSGTHTYTCVHTQKLMSTLLLILLALTCTHLLIPADTRALLYAHVLTLRHTCALMCTYLLMLGPSYTHICSHSHTLMHCSPRHTVTQSRAHITALCTHVYSCTQTGTLIHSRANFWQVYSNTSHQKHKPRTGNLQECNICPNTLKSLRATRI